MFYIISTVLAGVCWGCISLFLRPLTAEGFSSLQVMFSRAILSAFFMAICIFIKDRKLFRIKLRDLWMFIGSGVVSLTFFSMCYFKTILEVGTSIAVILLYTSPIFVLVLARILFNEKITVKKIIAIIATFIGCCLVGGIFNAGEKLISAKGFLIGLCAGLGYALYSIFGRYALRKYDSFTVTFYTFVFSALSLLPFIHINHMITNLNAKSLILFAGIAFLCTSVPYILYTFGLKGLDTGKAAILVTIEPLIGTLIGFFVWKEQMTVGIIIGILLIFFAVIISGLPDKNRDPSPS